MEHEFLRTIRAHIFYQRVQWGGLLIWQTVVWSQWLDWKQYFPSFAHSDWRIGLMFVAMVIGLVMHFYGVMKAIKPNMMSVIKSWSASLPETRRVLKIVSAALMMVAVIVFSIIIIGFDDRNIIDYRSILILAFTGTAWAAYAAELLLPHTMPELRKRLSDPAPAEVFPAE